MTAATITIVGRDGAFVFTRIEDASNPIVGSWLTSDSGGTGVLSFMADGSFMIAEDASPGSSDVDGMQRGTYSWNPATGVLTHTTVTDTTGGHTGTLTSTLQIDPGGATATLTNQKSSGATEVLTLTRAVDSTHPLVGGWFINGAGQAGGEVALTFLANGGFFMAQDGDSIADPSGQDGMQRGTYSWDASSGTLAHVTSVNTMGQWGLGADATRLVLDSTPGEVDNGGSGNDTLTGGDGDDVIDGGGGNDVLSGGAGNDALFGDDGNDSLSGGAGNDLLDGGTGADTMAGGSGDDTYVVDNAGDAVVESDALQASGVVYTLDIGGGTDKVVASINYTLGAFVENLALSGLANLSGTGNALANELAGNDGNNVITGLGGNDHIDGGAGIDTAVYSGPRSQYTLAALAGVEQVADTSGQEGIDTLANVERLRFADANVALDLQGHAGMVAKILGAVFGSASVGNQAYVGIGLGFADGGMSYEALTQLALDAKLGVGASHTAVVDLLYANVIGHAPDAATEASFVALLDNHTYTTASLGVLAADTSFNAVNVNLTGLAQTGLAYV
jgi:Ca2+-binding RTX toxin-like protein